MMFRRFMYRSLWPAVFWVPLSLVLMSWIVLLIQRDFFVLWPTLIFGVFLACFHLLLSRVSGSKNQTELTSRTSITLLSYYIAHFLWLVSGILLTLFENSSSFFWLAYFFTYITMMLRMVLLVLIYFEPFGGGFRPVSGAKSVGSNESANGKTPCFGRLMYQSLFVALVVIPLSVFVEGILHDGTLGAPLGLIFGFIALFWCGFQLILVRVAIHKNMERGSRPFFISGYMGLTLLPYYLCFALFLFSMDNPINSVTALATKLIPMLCLVLLVMVYCEPSMATSLNSVTDVSSSLADENDENDGKIECAAV